MKKIFLLVAFFAMLSPITKGQFIVVSDTNYVQLVNNFILSGVSASNVQYTGAGNTVGTFSNGGLTNLGMTDGIVMTTGSLITAPFIGNPVSGFATTANSSPGDTILNALIPGFLTYDASVLEFDFVPIGNMMDFQYVFASEEYPEYVGSAFNDVFGFFISGPNPGGGNFVNMNIALIPGAGVPVSINNVNAGLNSAYFIDNLALGGTTIVFDGFTTPLMATCPVTPGETYHLKMVIADAGDGIFDSGIFLKAQSMKSYMITGIEKEEVYNASIYPNPLNSSSVLNLNCNSTGIIELILMDQTGRIVSSTSHICNAPGSHFIPVGQFISSCSRGLYFLSVSGPDDVSIMKLVKN